MAHEAKERRMKMLGGMPSSSFSTKGLFCLKGKAAIVTGGAGILGRWLCIGLADFGARVAVVDINTSAARAVASEIAQRYNVRTAGIGCDVFCHLASVKGMLKQAVRELGDISILHNNAAKKTKAVDAYFAPMNKYSLTKWKKVMASNFDRMFLVAQAVGEHMSKRQKGSIIHTASIYGIMGSDQRIYKGSFYSGRPINTPAIYSASKSGVVALRK